MKDNLKKSLFSGIFWTGTLTITSKLIGLTSQVILAWLLVPDDFGKVTIALSFSSIIFLLLEFGIADVLISKRHLFDKLQDLSRSILLLSSLACFILNITFAYIFEWLYNDSDIRNLMLCFSLAIPFKAWIIIPETKLKIDLNFKVISRLKIIQFFFEKVFVVILVLFEFGIYGFVISPVISSFLYFLIIHNSSNVNYSFNFNLNRWRFLFYNSIWSYLFNLFGTLIRQVDYLILGLFVSKSIVGIYSIAYSFSIQSISLLTNSLNPVLFPTLMQIPQHNIREIKKVLIKIFITFCFLGMPFAMWQVVVAKPLVYLLLEPEWYESISLIQILSIGIAFHVSASLWPTALKLQSKFKIQAKYEFFNLIFFVCLAFPFTYFYGVFGIACSVTLSKIISTLFLSAVTFQNYGVNYKEVFIPVFKYFVIASIVFGINYQVSNLYDFSIVKSLIFNGLFSPTLYFILLYSFDKSFKELFIKLIFTIK